MWPLLILQGVFTELVEKLKVEDTQFDELYSFDYDTLKQVQPIRGVIFLFKYSKVDDDYAKNNNAPLDGEYDPDYQDHGIFFANQTIQNACGTQGVLNILLNIDDKIDIGEELKNFKLFVAGFDGMMAGETISNSEMIRQVHNSFSSPSPFVDEDKPNSQNNDRKNDGLFHFISYIRTNGFIYELDGLKTYPIKIEECNSDEEFITKLPQVIGRRIEKYGGESRFSLLAMTHNKAKHFSEIGDYNSFQREMIKRESWKKENELRRHDYVGFLVELLKNISKDMDDEQWENILDSARKNEQQNLLKRFSKSKGLDIYPKKS